MTLEQGFARAWKMGVARVLLYLIEPHPHCFTCTVQQPLGKRIREVRGKGLTEAEALEAALDRLEEVQKAQAKPRGQGRPEENEHGSRNHL